MFDMEKIIFPLTQNSSYSGRARQVHRIVQVV